MRTGETITTEFLELIAGGAAMARVDGFPLFVVNAYPGDVARVRLTEVKKGFGRGEIVELLLPSALRRAVPCPAAEDCGGCDWTALRLDAQLQAKEKILRESLRRIGKIDPALLPPITTHPSPLNYRLRSRLHREGDAVGFYAMRSNRVVPLPPECEVVGIETARAFGGHAAPGPESQESIAIWEVGGKLTEQGDLSIEGYSLATDAFFQVNRHLLRTMLRLATERASATRIRTHAVDLYAGVGFFSVPLAGLFQSVTSVEGSTVSHEYAKRNVPSNVELVQAAVEDYVDRMSEADLVFLDPPRSGAKANVIDALARKTKEMVCFLACDPVTFARDASRLIASGWRLATLDILDLFPNTHHVETLSSFERAP